MSVRWLQVFVVVAQLLVLATTECSSQEQQDEKIEVAGAYVKFPQISRTFIDQFFDSLRSKSGFVPSPLVASQVVDANTSGIWAGTRTEVETAIPQIVLRFRPLAEARLERATRVGQGTAQVLAEEFDITMAWEHRGVRLRHPLARDGYVQQGVLAESLAFKRSTARTEYFPAARESGIYVSVPAMLKSETDKAWGVLICPRVVSFVRAGPKGKPGVELLPSPYELSEVKVAWQGRASASIPFGSKRERIRVDQALTPDLPASLENHDEVTAVSPMLSLDYKPTAEFAFQRYPQDGGFRQGILLTSEMQNPWGHRRIQRFSHVLYVQRFDEPSPVAVIIKDNVASRDEGVCYIVAAQRSVWSQYDKVKPIE